eukprot:14589275-Alexandrium_andersonii.AAC.1
MAPSASSCILAREYSRHSSKLRRCATAHASKISGCRSWLVNVKKKVGAPSCRIMLSAMDRL